MVVVVNSASGSSGMIYEHHLSTFTVTLRWLAKIRNLSSKYIPLQPTFPGQFTPEQFFEDAGIWKLDGSLVAKMDKVEWW